MFKKILCFIFACLFTLSLCGCGKKVPWTANSFDTEVQKQKFSGNIIAENDKYSLEWVNNNCAISLIEKSTGKSWGVTPIKEGEPTVDEFGMPIKKNPRLESVLIVDYVNETSYALESVLSSTEVVSKGRVRTEKIDNGLKVEYYFDSIEVMIPVEYTLREDSVAITIDPAKIQENAKKIAAISIAPYWCSTENGSEDAYLFVPSGSGALVSTEETTQAGINYSAPIYGRDQAMTMDDYISPEKSVRLPVYGAKQGDKATCAIIENASESCNISVNAGAKNIGYSAVFATFQVRGYNKSFIAGGSNDQDVYASSMVKTPLTIGYYPLTENNANYSGIANTYKNYLNVNKLLNEKREDVALGVTIVGGKMVNRSFAGIPYKTLLPATTLKEAKKILEDISKKTDMKISAKLIGFGESGLDLENYAGGFQINKNLGSKRDLKELNDYCNENGIDLYFDFDLVRLKNSSSGFSSLFDVTQNTCYKVADLYEYSLSSRSRISDTKYNLLSRKYLVDGAEKLMKKTDSWSLTGISLETLTSLSYSDYADQTSAEYYSKANFGKDVTEIINTVTKKYKVASYDANAYSAYNSDIIYNAPNSSSKENIFSVDIPFYQMVFKGYVPMISEPLNLAIESRENVLKAVESGSGLGYVLTNTYDNEFSDSDSYYFFGSKYVDLSESLESNITELKDYYKNVKSKEIIGHEILENGLHLTEFTDGVKVYVNYTEKSLTSPLGEVEPYDFVWR